MTRSIFHTCPVLLALTALVSLPAGADQTPSQTVAASLPAPAADEPESQAIQATVTYCHDGDTCRVVTAPGKMWFAVRLAGIDAPEVGKGRKKSGGQPGGPEARDYLSQAVAGRSISLRQVDLDPFNRPVVEIVVDGRNLNLELISKGYAEVYRGQTKRIDKNAYLAAESKARQEKLGIWKIPGYQSPALFRKQNR